MMKLFKPSKIFLAQSTYGNVRSRVYVLKRKLFIWERYYKGFFLLSEVKEEGKWKSISDYPILLDKEVQRSSIDCMSQFVKYISKA